MTETPDLSAANCLDAFGRLLVHPSRLTRAERIDELRRLSGRLLADTDPAARWLGGALGEWLRNGGRFEARLEVAAPKGSHRTPQAHARQAEVDTLLQRLSIAAGGDRQAAQMLQGIVPVRPSAEALVQRLQSLRAPTSLRSIVRARTCHHR